MLTLKGALLADMQRVVPHGSAGAHASAILRNPGLQALAVYRFGRSLITNRRKPWLWPVQAFGWLAYGAAALFVRSAYGIELRLSADIGPGFYIGHFGGIEVRRCIIGARSSIGQHTKVLGLASGEHPVLGNQVWVGAHAVVLGKVTIGDGATIGAGARIECDVPPRALLLGNPARVVSRDYDNTAMV